MSTVDVLPVIVSKALIIEDAINDDKDGDNVDTESNKDQKKKCVLTSVQHRIQKIRETYSLSFSGCGMWSLDVDLGPPKSRRDELPIISYDDDEKFARDYYNSLQYTLYETGFPETIDRSGVPRTNYGKDDVTVTILSAPVECMGILLEGARQSPGSFCLVLSTSWLSKVPSKTHADLYSLYVHKAVCFDHGGSYIEEYDPPRYTTYFVNFFTGPVTCGQRTDGEQIEEDLDCQMSSSLKLAAITDDKVFSRCLMADVGMAFPETLAFMYKSDRLLKSSSDKIKIIHLDKNEGVDNLIREEVKEFTEKLDRDTVAKVVVKPSGAEFHSSIGVTYHDVDDVASITETASYLLSEMDPSNSVLVEVYMDTLTLKGQEPKPWGASNDLAARVRSTVCRALDNSAVVTEITCGIGSKAKPVHGDNTVMQTLDTTLLSYGVYNKEERIRVTEEINTKSEAVLEALIAYEDTLSVAEKGALFGQTDLIGVDFVISRIDGEIVPVGIEVNSHDCTFNCSVVQNMNAFMGYEMGKAFRPLIETMIQRSQLHIMAGKTILVIAGGAYSKKDIWPAAAKYGIKVVLVESDPEHFTKDQVYKFITYDFNDHLHDHTHAVNIIHQLEVHGIHVDGCLTFWEDCGPLAAEICELLELTGNGSNTAFIAKKKSLTQGVLRDKTEEIPHWPRTSLYTSNTQPITCEKDLHNIPENFTFPVVLKLEYGSSAVGVYFVHSSQELINKYKSVQESLQSEDDYGGVGLGFGNNMAVMDFLGGTEHDVDIVIYKRKMLAAFVSDNGPTRVPFFTETAATMPSTLPSDKVSQLITAAYQCCTDIGLGNGVFNVELKMTPTGPKLIEINARMGGFYLRDWIKRIYNVDLMLCAMMISCGVKPIIPKLKPKFHMMGVMLIPSLHGKFLHEGSVENNTIKGMTLNGDIVWNQFDQEAPEYHEGDHEEPMANIAVTGINVESVKHKLLRVCDSLKISSEKYSVQYFTEYF